MCGIFGILMPGRQAVNLPVARRALDLIRHRGPDDEGYILVDTVNRQVVPCAGSDTDKSLTLPDIGAFSDRPFSALLGHRRLSILDLSVAGHQPMRSAEGRYWIVFNGEIYNYLELRAELTLQGHVFITSSDTEVILAAYQQWGAQMLNRFIGMFALAIWDTSENTLFLARDFFGIKPLYYTRAGGKFAFASEIKPLLELDGVGRKGNPNQLYDCLGFGLADSGETTLFADIQQLLPAHYLHIDLSLKQVEPKRYWQLDLSSHVDISFREAADTLRKLFEESVRLHMRSDVPVGSCLSGGLDSSAIVMNMNNMLADGQQLHTFSYIVDDPIIGEEKYVDLICRDGDIISHKTRSTSEELIADLERLVQIQEQPFMGPSIYAQYRVFRLAHEMGMKVMLDGQGADELFSGYYSSIGARLASLVCRGQMGDVWRVLRNAPDNMKEHRLRMLSFSLGRIIPAGMVNRIVALTGIPSFPSCVDQNWFVERGVRHHMRPHGHGKDALREESLLSIEQLSLPQLLRYEDRNSMCFSIESRVPFCSKAIAEFALSLPDHFLLSNEGVTKSVFREAMKDLVPQVILRRDKVGFATPARDWQKLLLPWTERTALNTELNNVPFLKKDSLMQMLKTSSQQKQASWPINAWRCSNLLYWTQAFDVDWS
ncbi:MAG: asparagine synthase (glutamine-hydrolyzing) [Desulfuromonadales bacterium]|nr:asparagine synthase (glutamine-hydrolyzing) [Desulfuromonadales bacterium]